LREALLVCGATDDEATRFAAAIVERIRQVGAACGEATELEGSRHTMKAG
jgi:hypothetical protein